VDAALNADRRATARVRFAGGVLPPPARVRHRSDVTLVDLSSGGALVEGACRLRPGSRVELRIGVEAERVTVPARVHRCFVSTIDRHSGVRYRAALTFELPLTMTPPPDLLAEYAEVGPGR